jgi:hypothetical protein
MYDCIQKECRIPEDWRVGQHGWFAERNGGCEDAIAGVQQSSFVLVVVHNTAKYR